MFVFSCTRQTSEEIADLRTLRQDCLAYIPAGAERTPLMTPQEQGRLYEDFREKFFSPWHQAKPATSSEKVRLPFEKYARSPGYGENARPHEPDWADGLLREADLKNYPNRRQRAITVRNTDLREMPTLRPRFDSWDKPGYGYPFDTLQTSAVWIGTPVLVLHVSKTGRWLFVETPFAAGWMPAEDVAAVDEKAAHSYEKPPLVAVLEDNLPIHASTGSYLGTAHIGAVFPLASEREDCIRVLVPRGYGRSAFVSITGLPKDKVAIMPLALTPGNVARVANHMLGQPYGWGGLYELRDCSATTRDILTPFGLWLPRDSADQAKAGTVIPLKNLSGTDKETLIHEKGAPFLTLIRSPGHIMLYVGRHNGRVLVLHNTWGVKCVAGETPATREGRKIIGRCVITTLQPGIELPNIILPQGDLRNRVESMILLLPR